MDQFSIAFPRGSVLCAEGDYLVCQSVSGWKVYLVEDLLLIKRLIPALNDPSMLFIEEHMLDSIAPAYFNEVQLLLTEFDSSFTDESEAVKAIQRQTLTERAKRLLRPATKFPESDCRVVQRADPP